MNNYYERSRSPQKQMHYSPNLVNTIDNAIESGKVLAVQYESREKGITERELEPIDIVYKDKKRNLIAYCRLREDYRSFRLDRINLVKIKVNETFQNHIDFDIDQYLEDTAHIGRYNESAAYANANAGYEEPQTNTEDID